MNRAEAQRLAEYLIDGEHICPVCDEAVLSDHDGYCSDECRDTAAERAWEGHCERFYGGSAPYTMAEQSAAAFEQKRSGR